MLSRLVQPVIFKGRQVRLCGFIALGLGAAFMGAFSPSALATSDTWDGTDSALWSASNNWLTNPVAVPGTGDIATFSLDSATINARTTIDLGAGVTVGSLLFDTASVAAYTIGSGGAGAQTLALNNATIATMNATVAANQLINANVRLGTAATATYSILNSSTTNSINIAGTIQGGTGGTAGAITLNSTGAGAVNISNSVTAGGGTSIALGNTGAGTLTLSGGTSTLAGLSASAGKIVISGATVTSSALSTYTGSTFELQSGSVAFNAGVRSGTSDGTLIKVSGGTFSATSVQLQRTAAITSSTNASTTTGFIVSGGSASISGTFSIGTNNSSASSLITGGSVTVAGATNLGNTTHSGRYNILQVTGGSFTSTNTATGIALSINTTTANKSSLNVTGGTVTTEKISFGAAASFAGSEGNVFLNGATASLYVGSGGMVLVSANSYTSNISLTAGTLGAKANWSSSLAMTLNGTADALSIKAADETNVARNITLDGALTGTGGFTKTGNGVLSLGGTNSYQGATTVSAGTLLVNGSHTGGGNYTVTASGAKLGGAGSITGASASSITLGANSFLMAGKTHGTGAGADTTAQILTLTTGAGDINLNGTLQFDLFSSSGDQLDLNTGAGFLNLAGGKVELAVGQDASTALWGTSFTSWKLIDWANLTAFDTAGLALTSSTISTFQSLGYTLTQSIVDDGTANAGFYVNIALAPEPTRAVLLCLGLGTLLFTRRRSSRAANPCDAFVLQ